MRSEDPNYHSEIREGILLINLILYAQNVELMQRVVKNSKSRGMEPGCQAYFFFVPEDGNEDFLYGVEMYLPLVFRSVTQVMTTRRQSKKRTSIPLLYNPLLPNFPVYFKTKLT
jgi:hypothetical protein